jgi:hypothetical protein
MNKIRHWNVSSSVVSMNSEKILKGFVEVATVIIYPGKIYFYVQMENDIRKTDDIKIVTKAISETIIKYLESIIENVND